MAASRLSKGKIEEVVKKFRWFPLARPEKYGGSYLKNAWAEIPEVRINVSSDIWVLMQGKFYEPLFFKYSKLKLVAIVLPFLYKIGKLCFR